MFQSCGDVIALTQAERRLERQIKREEGGRHVRHAAVLVVRSLTMCPREDRSLFLSERLSDDQSLCQREGGRKGGGRGERHSRVNVFLGDDFHSLCCVHGRGMLWCYRVVCCRSDSQFTFLISASSEMYVHAAPLLKTPGTRSHACVTRYTGTLSFWILSRAVCVILATAVLATETV